ncbi:MAG: gentisate 1,2-dioxygenase [Alphaproteobacteria bacterium]|nr:gentisate 1,2-dioxygenase [Alphaproteobacteria bacterium]
MTKTLAAAPPASHNISPARRDFYREIAPQNLAPLWEVLHQLVTAEPQSIIKPHCWKYADIRPHLMKACALITAKEAERRVLVLENPALPGESKITRSLFAGLQIILPGEIAPPHRHTQTALRFVVEGRGAYTGVDGERTEMHPGDFVITPSWTWHDHGNNGNGPMVWLDVLDIHMLKLFEASFREGSDSDEARPEERPRGDSMARYGSNLLPVDGSYSRPTSPVFNYPYDRTREALEAMRRREEWNPWHGLKLKYINPMNGDYAIPTIATFIQLLPKGFRTQPYRSTDSTIYVCVEGSGTTMVGGKTMAWGPRDIVVVPSWERFVHHASEDAVLFSASDRGVQEKLGFWREEKVNG